MAPNMCTTYMQRCVVCVIIFVVCGLLVLLTASFLLVHNQNTALTGDKRNASVHDGCTNYTYSTCRKELSLKSACSVDAQASSECAVMIASNVDQPVDVVESVAKLVKYSLKCAGATEECQSYVTSFMCSYLFPLCDEHAGTVYKPSIEDCIEITTGVCREDWQKMLELPGVSALLQKPDCKSLELNREMNVSLNTPIVDNKSNGLSTLVVDSHIKNLSTELINCSKGFFLRNGTCLPRCGEWNVFSDPFAKAVDVAQIASGCLTVVFGLILIVGSLIDYKRMFAFPSVLIVNLIIFQTIDGLTTLITFVDKEALFCSSESLIEALQMPTTFCSIIESLHIYCAFETSIWWFSYIASLFFQIMFPFRARMSKINGQSKFIFVGILIPALLVPFVALIAIVESGGFVTWNFTPSICVEQNIGVAFYIVILPLNVFTVLGTSLLIMVIALLIKNRSIKTDAAKSLFTAHYKIVLVLCYCLVVSTVSTGFGTLGAKPDNQFVVNVYGYFYCEANGSSLCNVEKRAYEAATFPEADIIYHVLKGTIPAATLIFIFRFEKANFRRNTSMRSITTQRNSINLKL